MKTQRTILIVDDEPDIRRLIEAGLKSNGYQTLTASTAEEGLKLAKENSPSLVLFDVVMPGMDGMTACRKLKAQSDTFIPVILVTVKSDVDSKVQGSEHGADDYLTKPFVMQELLAKVKSMLRIKEHYEQLEKSSITDGLTGLPNRRYFDARFKEECDRSRRIGKPFSFLIFDLDHFKELNDQHGHSFGDQVLQVFGERVKGLIRKTDMFARIGGEEFGLILPETALEEGFKMGKMILESLNQIPIETPAPVKKITCSIGLAVFPSRLSRTPKELYENADSALYDAKNSGRNMVKIFSGPAGLGEGSSRSA